MTYKTFLSAEEVLRALNFLRIIVMLVSQYIYEEFLFLFFFN